LEAEPGEPQRDTGQIVADLTSIETLLHQEIQTDIEPELLPSAQ